jgi:hypothetical protein
MGIIRQGIVVYSLSSCKLGFKGPRVPKKAQFTHKRVEYNVFFCSTRPLKAANRFKFLKLALRFILTSCDIYQNPFTQEKILKL